MAPGKCEAFADGASAYSRSERARAPTDEDASTRMVGLGRLELPTSRLSSARSNQLSYKPSANAKRSSDVANRSTTPRRMRSIRRSRRTQRVRPVERTRTVQPLTEYARAKACWARPGRKRNVDGGRPAKIGLTGRDVPSDPIGKDGSLSTEGSSLERR
jgi:hypothetical protein